MAIEGPGMGFGFGQDRLGIVRSICIGFSGIFLSAQLMAWSNSGIFGRVIDTQGRRLHGKVGLKPLDPARALAEAKLDNGTFLFRPVAPGEYSLQIDLAGFKPRRIPVQVPMKSEWINVGSIVLQPAVFGEGFVIPYEPQNAPIWLKTEPNASFLDYPDRLPACRAIQHHGRRIKVNMDLIEFFVPRFAHVTGASGFEGDVWHYIWFGPEQNNTRLIIVYGQDRAGLPWQHAPPADTVWTKSRWLCRDLDGTDGSGIAPDGRRWRYITLLDGVAQYDGVPPKAAEYFDKILDSMCCGAGPKW